MSVADLRSLVAVAGAGLIAAACGEAPSRLVNLPEGDPPRGKAVIQRVGCGACHTIPGVRWPQGTVGPSLQGFADRRLIAGRFPNEPGTLALWVRNAPALIPETGMTPMPLTEEEARDVAAYLYTLDAG